MLELRDIARRLEDIEERIEYLIEGIPRRFPMRIGRRVIFDPSLLSPYFHDILLELLRARKLRIILTEDMFNIMYHPPSLSYIFKLWHIAPYHESVYALLERIRRDLAEGIMRIPEEAREVDEMIEGNVIERIKVKDFLAKFIADEITLSLATKYPIFCVSTSPWRIVEFFKKAVRGKVRELHVGLEEKARMLRSGRFVRIIIAAALNAAFVYVIAPCPLTAISTFGVETLMAVIVDG